MPELPEVETVCRGLAPVMEGRTFTGVGLNRADLRFPFPRDFVESLRGARVLNVSRLAKYIVISLDTGDSLIVHLGMTGRISVSGHTLGDYVYDTGADSKHDHVVFQLDGVVNVTYNDPRRFGFMDMVETRALWQSKHFSKMGPEPLSNMFSGPILKERLEGKATPLKAALLDQSVVAGLGNIYVCEALFRAKLSPRRLARTLSANRAESLVLSIRDVLNEAIAVGGSTLRDFAATDGVEGAFQESFRVYGREGGACVAPGCNGTVRRIVQSGRSTFYCGVCQR
jgi:formamidopyrimidine-DNA glycosylase